MIYGYSHKIVDEQYGLLQLREVSFEFAPSELRRIAAFLNSTADAIEQNALRSDHVHIGMSDDRWNADCPECDIIVLQGSPDGPAVVE